MNQIITGVGIGLGMFAIGFFGALVAASAAREYHHAVNLLYFVGGFSTVADALLVYGS